MNSHQFLMHSSLLLLLAAEGAAFDRAELDRMLDKVAKSNPPQDQLSFGASCYEISMPPLRRYEYLCPKCGKRSIYPSDFHKETLLSLRKTGIKIKGKGITLELDESEYCYHCSGQENQLTKKEIPVKGKLKSNPAIELIVEGEGFDGFETDYNEGKNLLNVRRAYAWVKRSDLERKNKENSSCVGISLFLAPDEKTSLSCIFDCPSEMTFQLYLGAKEKTTPEGWIQIVWETSYGLIPIPSEELEITEKKEVMFSKKIPALYWISKLGEKETKTQAYDIDSAILSAFLEGKDIVAMGRGSVRPLKEFLPRLRTIFGIENLDKIQK